MIKINFVSKIYNQLEKTRVFALDRVSFEIIDGEIISIIGKTGSGKTTLANLLLGITKPTDGSITIDDIENYPKAKKRKIKAITNNLLSSFQYPDHQLFRTTVKDEILFNSNDEKYMFELLKEFNLNEDILDKSPFKLSSGQKRKIILISLLIQNPKAIILDEATAFLDPASRREFIDLIKKINKTHNTTIIFISHNMEDVKKISDRAVLLEKGNLITIGDSDEVVERYLRGDYYE